MSSWANKNELDLMEKIVNFHLPKSWQMGIYGIRNGPKLPFCILDCDVELHPYEVEPPVGYKHNGKIMWDLKPKTEIFKYSR